MADAGDRWEQHDHDPVVHSHGHYHVTHNFRDMTGGFEHLSSFHEHEHDHAGMRHTHYPHEDFDREHEGEAHVHDHAEAVKADGSRDGAAKKATAKKAAAKKAS